MVSMIGPCQYIYRCKTVGLDTIEVFVRNREKKKHIGEQVVVVKERPLPEANIAGLKGGTIIKGDLKVQPGVGAQYYIAGNHWESCIVESFSFIVLRNNKVVMDFHNEGNLFSDKIKAELQNLEHGDKLIIANIKGCSMQGGGNLKSLEFIIE